MRPNLKRAELFLFAVPVILLLLGLGYAHFAAYFTTPKPIRLMGHMGYIRAMAFSADSKLFATGSDDATIKIWNAGDGTLAETLQHSRDVKAVAIAPDGKTIAYGGFTTDARSRFNGGEVFLQNIKSGQSRQIMKGLGAGIWSSLVFSPDGSLLAGGTLNGLVQVWDVESGKLVRTLTGHRGEVRRVLFSPDGKLLLSRTGSTETFLRDTTSWRGLRHLKGDSFAFSPDSKLLIVGASHPTTKLMLQDTRTGRIIWQKDWKQGDRDGTEIPAVAFSPDGKSITSLHSGAILHQWDTQSGEDLRTWNTIDARVSGTMLSPDGKVLAGSDFDSKGPSAQLWRFAP